MESQERFFSTQETRSLEFRKAALLRLAAAIEKRSDQVLEALSSDLGKPGLEAYVSEVYFTLTEIRFFLKNLTRWSKPEKVGSPFYFFPAKSEIRYEPFGTSLIVAPWNYPFQLSLSPLIASVAAGNCVMLKPSELAPATAELLASLIGETFDPDHVTVVNGGIEVAEGLLELPFKHWLYTGSEKVGRVYAEAAAKHLAPIVLELGGKCPCVLDSDIDLDQTVERIASTKFFNAGQTCIAPDFVVIPEELHDSFVQKLKVAMEAYFVDPKSPDLGRIVSASHFERLKNLVSEDSIQIGEDDEAKSFLAPRILPRAAWDSPAMKDEIFGPVLPVIASTDAEETMRQLRKFPSPLALYVFSRDKQFQEKIAGSIQSGSVCFNDAIKQATVLDLPFGGVGASGMGRYRGRAGFEAFSYARSVTRRYFFKDVFAVKPPYGNQLEKLRRLLK
tara:strand:- start:383 stop:1723 length:1341 start_codon:yes stop_codon:yes gene_type:complete